MSGFLVESGDIGIFVQVFAVHPQNNLQSDMQNICSSRDVVIPPQYANILSVGKEYLEMVAEY